MLQNLDRCDCHFAKYEDLRAIGPPQEHVLERQRPAHDLTIGWSVDVARNGENLNGKGATGVSAVFASRKWRGSCWKSWRRRNQTARSSH